MSGMIANEFYPIDLHALPGSWSSCPIGTVVEDVQSGFPCGANHREAEGVPHLRPMNVSRQGDLDLSDLKYVSADVSDLRVSAGDVLFNNTNSPELIGKTAVIPIGAPSELAFSNHMTRLRVPNGLNSRFSAYQLHFLWMSGYFRHRCTNHVNQASLSSSALAESVPFVFAPTREQDRIVDEIEKQFTRLDAATAALKRVQANLKRYRASVLKAACEGRLVPTEAELARQEGRDYEPADKLLQRILRERRARWEADTLAKMQASGKPPKDNNWKQKYKEPTAPDTSNLPPLPKGWCWASADQICSKITDGEHIQPPYQDSGRPLLTAKHVQDGWVDFRDFGLIDEESFAKARARCAPVEGDVLIVSVGATTGRTGMVRGEPPFAIVRSVLLLRPILSSRYLLTWAQSPSCQDWIRSASGSTAQAHFYISDAKRMPVALAPELEQLRIADEKDRMLSVLDALQAALVKKVKASASLRQAILRHAFTGQLVPQDPTDEPASVLLERIRAERASSEAGRPSRKRRTEHTYA